MTSGNFTGPCLTISETPLALLTKNFLIVPAHPSLQLERLRSDARFWSVRVTRDYRAVAQRFEGNVWVWVWIGIHKDFERQFPT
jgi:hypothetical protein